MPYKPLLNEIPYKYKPIINRFDGVNNGLPIFEIGDTEATDMKNIDSRKFPALHPRVPRSNYGSTLSFVYHIGKRQDNYIHVVDDTTWKYWNGTSWAGLTTGVAAANASSVDFMDKTILCNGTNNLYWDGSTVGTVATMPNSHYVTVHANRIYAANKDNQNLNFSSLHKYNDWTTANDAGTIVVETRDGEGCTGLTTYGNHVIYFKQHSMHELYGTGPKNYAMNTTSNQIGCISNRTIKEVKGRLFWLGHEGVYVYTGGTAPELISGPIQGYIDRLSVSERLKACAGTDGERYYLNLPIDSETKIMLVFDTRSHVNRWFVEDDIDILEFVEFNNTLYAASYTQIKNMIDENGSEVVDWYWTSKPYNDGAWSALKSWYKLYVPVTLPTGSTLSCALSTDAEEGTFTTAKTFTASSSIQNAKVDIPLATAKNTNWVRVKFSGTGDCTVFGIEKQIRITPSTF